MANQANDRCKCGATYEEHRAKDDACPDPTCETQDHKGGWLDAKFRPAEPQRTLKDLAVEALAVQDACNLSGVAQGFARAMLDLRRAGNLDTNGLNTHPITIVWLDKLCDLAGVERAGTTKAFTQVYKIVEEG